jgi:hypothetical protein
MIAGKEKWGARDATRVYSTFSRRPEGGAFFDRTAQKKAPPSGRRLNDCSTRGESLWWTQSVLPTCLLAVDLALLAGAADRALLLDTLVAVLALLADALVALLLGLLLLLAGCVAARVLPLALVLDF